MIIEIIMMIAGEAQAGYKDAEIPKKEEINKQQRLRWTITLTIRIRRGFPPGAEAYQYFCVQTDYEQYPRYSSIHKVLGHQITLAHPYTRLVVFRGAGIPLYVAPYHHYHGHGRALQQDGGGFTKRDTNLCSGCGCMEICQACRQTYNVAPTPSITTCIARERQDLSVAPIMGGQPRSLWPHDAVCVGPLSAVRE